MDVHLGTPEVDWFLAEERVSRLGNDFSEKPAIVAAAEVMGSTLGSVAGVVASLGMLVHSGVSEGD